MTKKLEFKIKRLGKGKNRLGIIFGQHGDEPVSLLIAQMLETEAGKTNFNPTTVLIGPVNDSGLTKAVRTETITGKDFNRSFPGRVDGDFVDKRCKKIFGICKKCELVVDIHNFVSAQIANTAYVPGSTNAKVATRSLLYASQLKGVMVKNLNNNSAGTLVGELAKVGIPGFILETSPLELNNKKNLTIITRGLINIIKRETGNRATNTSISIFKSSEKFVVPANSTFVPNENLSVGKVIKKNSLIGCVYYEGKKENIKNKKQGVLQAISPLRFCRESTEVAILCKCGEMKLK
ncbi:MAG: hypothetical protein ACD_22C00030G0007 [uncultured bacterium]|nr:MAG: hypothetical protein ACD_22C00030G0007 [uncultured bacterium]